MGITVAAEVLVFPILQLLISLLYRCKKQRKQLGAATLPNSVRLIYNRLLTRFQSESLPRRSLDCILLTVLIATHARGPEPTPAWIVPSAPVGLDHVPQGLSRQSPGEHNFAVPDPSSVAD